MAPPTSRIEQRFFSIYQRYASPSAASHGRTFQPRTTPTFSIPQRQLHASRSLCQESLRPPNHYELFPQSLPSGPPPGGSFDIDARALRAEFLRLQAKAHPDVHSGARDKARAEGASSLINEAYRTLQDPLRRAQYLLALRGMDVAEDETAKVEDPELLAEVLEAREAIEEAQAEDELGRLREVNEQRARESVSRLAGCFERDDIGGAKEEAVRLRYWVNIGEALHGWEKGKPVVLNH